MHYLRATALLPTDGIVRDTARDIVHGAKTDEDKARAIYEWIVDNTFREPKVRGCGIGDIRTMLETGNLSGKCADLNALFVGLARAAGLPARDVYGIRVADSRFGYKSLGKSGNVSKAQHCRAEVFLERFGWVPVDPADVRKVVLEEPPGKLSMVDPKVAAVRKQLFGAWEMNWLAYNDAHDLRLPNSTGKRDPLPDVSPGRARRPALRQPGPRRLQLHAERTGNLPEAGTQACERETSRDPEPSAGRRSLRHRSPRTCASAAGHAAPRACKPPQTVPAAASGAAREDQERRGGGRRGGNKATQVRGTQRRVCVAAPAASSTEGRPERQRRVASVRPARRPTPRPRTGPDPARPCALPSSATR
jgi:hypothetical protein